MSEFTDEHADGVNAFRKALEGREEACEHCGFSGTVLHGDWEAEVAQDHRSSHVVYELTCPDCRETCNIEVNL